MNAGWINVNLKVKEVSKVASNGLTLACWFVVQNVIQTVTLQFLCHPLSSILSILSLSASNLTSSTL